MPRIQGATFGDVTDRDTRQLGHTYGTDERTGYSIDLGFSVAKTLNTLPVPWWAHYPAGRVIELDDFEGTLKWAALGGAISKASDATFVHSGTSAMKLATGAAAGGAQAAIHLVGPVKEDSAYVVMEFWWTWTAAAEDTPRDFFVDWWIHDQWLNIGPHFGIRYLNHSAAAYQRKFQYWGAAGAWVDIAGGTYKTNLSAPQWNHWMIVLSRTLLGGYKYEFVRMNDSIFILTGIAGQAGAFDLPSQPVWITTTTDAAAVTTAYVDDFVIMDECQYHS